MIDLRNKKLGFRLLSATALGTCLILSPTTAAAAPVATVVDSGGTDLAVVIFNDDVDGVSVSGVGNGASTGIVVDVFGAINASDSAVSVNNGDPGNVVITVDADVHSTGGGGVYAQADAGNVTVTGSSNITSDSTNALTAVSTDGSIIISGTGDTTSNDNTAIYTNSTGSFGNTTITRSGTISGVTNGIYAQLVDSGGDTNFLSLTGIGAVSASADNSITVIMNNQTNGNVTLNTSNAIINTGAGTTIGLIATSAAGVTNITVGDVTMNAVSDGFGLHLNNAANATYGTNIIVNGTISSGDVSAGAQAITGEGNSAVTMNLTIASTAVVNGIIDISGSKGQGSIFDNRGVWNGFGADSTFSGFLNNGGTINLQNNDASDKIYVSDGIVLTTTSVIKVDANDSATANTDIFYVTGGNISLGGTLDVNAIGAEALYSATSGKTYYLFKNTGGGTVNDSFATLTDNLAYLDLEVNIVFDEVVYHFVTSAIDFKPFANGTNQYNAAVAMDDFDYTSTEGQTLLAAFGALTNDEAEDAIKQISGGDHQSSMQSGAPIAYGFEQAMMGGANGGTTGGGNPEPQATGYTVSATGDVPAIGTAIWARAIGGYAKLDKGTTAADLSRTTFGVVGGVEYYLNDDARLGLSTGYTRANFSVQTTGSSSYADNFHAGLSAHLGASSAFDAGFGLSAGADITQHNFHTKRNIAIGAVTSTATADYSGVTIGGIATARYGMNIGNNIILSSFAGLDASQTNNTAFAETGAGLLNISTDASSSQKLGSNIGFGVARKTGDISTAISAAWRYEFGDVNHTNTHTLAGSPTSYTSTTPTEARNKIMLKANLGLSLSDNSSLTFGAFGDLSLTTVNVGASAGYKFKF